MKRLRVSQVIIVEGRYDAIALANFVDGLILTTDGFSIFSDIEKKELIRTLGKQRGLIVLTDSDAAGFSIRNYINKIAAGCQITNAYVPSIKGKESRKATASKEGLLGVEGFSTQVLYSALQQAGIQVNERAQQGKPITYTDLYRLGLSGTQGSAEKRRDFLHTIGLPQRLSKKALCQVLNTLYTKAELEELMREKPTLFWDFHGTLTLPDVSWFTAAMQVSKALIPHRELTIETLQKHFTKSCLPWWTIPDKDTQHLVNPADWWAYCENEFTNMFEKCGFTNQEAKQLAAAMRQKVIQPSLYTLYDDAVTTLKTLQQLGYKSYILSNNFPELPALVQGLGIAPYFEDIFTSATIGFEKPRKEIFEFACKQANVNPSNAYMIGDNPIDDIQGGKQAGFTTIGVQGLKTQNTDYTVNTLAQIIPILQQQPHEV